MVCGGGRLTMTMSSFSFLLVLAGIWVYVGSLRSSCFDVVDGVWRWLALAVIVILVPYMCVAKRGPVRSGFFTLLG
jgi:hypothetical protein